MGIGDFVSYSTSGFAQGSVYTQKPLAQQRAAVTLDAEPDPKTPYQYAVQTKPQVIPPPERASEAKSTVKKPNQNNDPVSRAFLAVADYQPVHHRIDIRV
jgi:hypothetical protein